MCSCQSGYTLAEDGLECIDDNECSLNNGHGPCQDVCANTEGGYKCSCRSGTTLANDGHTCQSSDGCDLNNGGCSHQCIDSYSQVFCLCPQGREIHVWQCFALVFCYALFTKVEKISKGSLDSIPSPSPGRCQQTFENKKFVALLPQVNFPSNILNFHWRWWDRIQAVCLNLFYFSQTQVRAKHCRTWTSLPQGYSLASDWKECRDTDECLTENGGCEQMCVNEPGQCIAIFWWHQFLNHLFSKMMPNFWQLATTPILKIQSFPLGSMLFFRQKSF